MSANQPELAVDLNKITNDLNSKANDKDYNDKDLNLEKDKEKTEIKNDEIRDEESKEKKRLPKFKFDLSKEPESISEMLEEIKNVLHNLLIGNVDESRSILKQREHVSFFYEICVSFLEFIDCLLKLDKESLEKTLHTISCTNKSVNKYRKKHGLIGYLIRGNFSKHSDVEVYAESAYAFTQILSAMTTALLDQGIYGIVNGGIKAKNSYSSIKNCTYVLEDKKEWESEISQKNFEANTRVFIGIYDLIVSFTPSKIARILDLIGFSSDRIGAIKNIKKAYEIQDTCVRNLALVALLIYYLFLNFFFGVGETDIKFICESTKKWEKLTSKEVFLDLGKGSRDMVLGNPKKAIEYFEKVITGRGHYRQIVYICYWQLVWSNCMLCNWSEAARYSKLLRVNCNWSRALFHYLHAIFMQLQMDLEGKKFLREPIMKCLSLVPKIKRNLGGRLAFHELIVLERSKGFVNKPEEMLLPCLELMYIWNIFNMMGNNTELFKPIMNLIDTKLEILDKKDDKKYLDKYCYLIFIKGVILRHMNKKSECLKCFDEIIKNDSKLTEKNLAPQACFEMGMVYYETNDFKQAKKWLKKVRNLYSSYLTQSLIDYRVQWTLDLIKSKKK